MGDSWVTGRQRLAVAAWVVHVVGCARREARSHPLARRLAPVQLIPAVLLRALTPAVIAPPPVILIYRRVEHAGRGRWVVARGVSARDEEERLQVAGAVAQRADGVAGVARARGGCEGAAGGQRAHDLVRAAAAAAARVAAGAEGLRHVVPSAKTLIAQMWQAERLLLVPLRAARVGSRARAGVIVRGARAEAVHAFIQLRERPASVICPTKTPSSRKKSTGRRGQFRGWPHRRTPRPQGPRNPLLRSPQTS